MKSMVKLRWRRLLLAAGLLGLWPTGGLRAQGAVTMADAETSAETVKCDTIRLTWEAKAGEEKSLSFAFENKISFFTVDWGDGVSSEESRGQFGITITMKHVYVEAGTYEVLLYAMPYVKPIGLVGESYTETAFGMEMPMVAVDGGTFTMGCTSEQGSDCYSSESPSHSVTLDGFYIGKYEVTQAQWLAVMGTNCCESSYGLGDDYPMYFVSWTEAQAFCDSLSRRTGRKYRLPTEAEWEYAARGGQKADGTRYAGSNTIGDVAWYSGNSGNTTHPVGQKKPNGLGLYDMSGNVMEWCQDWYDEDYYGESPAVNPQGPSSGSNRVLRGGGLYHDARGCRVSSRNRATPDYRNNAVGFRVVCGH